MKNIRNIDSPNRDVRISTSWSTVPPQKRRKTDKNKQPAKYRTGKGALCSTFASSGCSDDLVSKAASLIRWCTPFCGTMRWCNPFCGTSFDNPLLSLSLARSHRVSIFAMKCSVFQGYFLLSTNQQLFEKNLKSWLKSLSHLFFSAVS